MLHAGGKGLSPDVERASAPLMRFDQMSGVRERILQLGHYWYEK
jgi:hypothetical protein